MSVRGQSIGDVAITLFARATIKVVSRALKVFRNFRTKTQYLTSLPTAMFELFGL